MKLANSGLYDPIFIYHNDCRKLNILSENGMIDEWDLTFYKRGILN